MLADLAVLIASLAVLVKSAEVLVERAALIAQRFRISDLVVGLLLTSVGTSLPELTSSIAASLAGSSALVIGNVVGSNIANIGLVIGFAALVRPFSTEQKMHDRDGFVLIASVALFFALAQDNRFGRVDAAIFLFVYVAYVVFIARSDTRGVEQRFGDFLEFMFGFERVAPLLRGLRERKSGKARAEPTPGVARAGLGKDLLLMGLSTAALIVSAGYVVSGAIGIARALDVPENLIGLSLVAVGTSLPELLVAVVAARGGRAELIVGNVIGSNIANALLICGIAGMIHPLDVPELSVVYTIPIMLFFSLALLHFIRSDWRITRAQGAAAVVAYVVFLTLAFVQGWG